MLLLPCLLGHWPAWSPGSLRPYWCHAVRKLGHVGRPQVSDLRSAILKFMSFQADHQICVWMNWYQRHSQRHWVIPRDIPSLWDCTETPDLVETTQAVLTVPFVNSWFMESLSTVNWLLFYASKFGMVCYVTVIIGTVIKLERLCIVSVRNRLLLKLIRVGTTCWINVCWFFFFFHFKWR